MLSIYRPQCCERAKFGVVSRSERDDNWRIAHGFGDKVAGRTKDREVEVKKMLADRDASYEHLGFCPYCGTKLPGKNEYYCDSWFPLRIKETESGKEYIVNDPKDIPSGIGFTVMACCVRVEKLV